MERRVAIECRIKEGYFGVSSINRHSTLFQACQRLSPTSPTNMKCIAIVVLLALFGFALAKPLESESLEPVEGQQEPVPVESDSARNKRGLLLGAAYTAPVAYSAAYAAPVAYSSAYTYPYAYAGYSSYPYYAATYTSPYILP